MSTQLSQDAVRNIIDTVRHGYISKGNSERDADLYAFGYISSLLANVIDELPKKRQKDWVDFAFRTARS